LIESAGLNTCVVGLGEIWVSDQPGDMLVIYGLGSCVGIGMFDPETRIAGLLHAVLPRSADFSGEQSPRYVDTGIELLLQRMRLRRADSARLIVWMAGGAHMIGAPGFNIGLKNIDAARTLLAANDIAIATEFLGGNIGRTMRIFVGEGRADICAVPMDGQE
jgi:chemotaxis protein CheD